MFQNLNNKRRLCTKASAPNLRATDFSFLRKLSGRSSLNRIPSFRPSVVVCIRKRTHSIMPNVSASDSKRKPILSHHALRRPKLNSQLQMEVTIRPPPSPLCVHLQVFIKRFLTAEICSLQQVGATFPNGIRAGKVP